MRNIILSFIILNGVITFSSCKNSNQFSEINYDKAMAIATTTLAMPVDSVVYGCIGEKKLIVVRVVDTASFKSIKDNELKILSYSNDGWKEVEINYSHEDEGDIERGNIADISLVTLDGKGYIYYSIASPDFFGHDGGRMDYVLVTYPECKTLVLSFHTTEDRLSEIINERNKAMFPNLIAFLETKSNNK